MPSSSPRPRFTEEEARRLARDLYGLKGGLRELPSERDQNFHVRDESGREFVLKIANAAEEKEVLEFQNQAMCRLKNEVPQIAWPERMKERGILISTEGPFRNVLKIRPPLVFTKTDADFLLETLEQVLEESALQPG